VNPDDIALDSVSSAFVKDVAIFDIAVERVVPRFDIEDVILFNALENDSDNDVIDVEIADVMAVMDDAIEFPIDFIPDAMLSSIVLLAEAIELPMDDIADAIALDMDVIAPAIAFPRLDIPEDSEARIVVVDDAMELPIVDIPDAIAFEIDVIAPAIAPDNVVITFAILGEMSCRNGTMYVLM
jgi:hypothetical protein